MSTLWHQTPSRTCKYRLLFKLWVFSRSCFSHFLLSNRRNSSLTDQFKADFPGSSLLSVMCDFSLPTTLADHKAVFPTARSEVPPIKSTILNRIWRHASCVYISSWIVAAAGGPGWSDHVAASTSTSCSASPLRLPPHSTHLTLSPLCRHFRKQRR